MLDAGIGFVGWCWVVLVGATVGAENGKPRCGEPTQGL